MAELFFIWRFNYTKKSMTRYEGNVIWQVCLGFRGAWVTLTWQSQSTTMIFFLILQKTITLQLPLQFLLGLMASFHSFIPIPVVFFTCVQFLSTARPISYYRWSTFCDEISTIDKAQVSSFVERSLEHFNFYRLVQWQLYYTNLTRIKIVAQRKSFALGSTCKGDRSFP